MQKNLLRKREKLVAILFFIKERKKILCILDVYGELIQALIQGKRRA
jgi:hypothetical protein